MQNGRRAAGVAGMVVALGLGGLVGCSGRTDRAAPNIAATPSGLETGAAGAPGQAAPTETPRQVISTATMRMEVRDVAAATTRAGQLAVERGGFVAGSEESGAAEERRSRVTLKVPGDGFDRLVQAVADLGDVQSKQVGTEDVTEQVVDGEARLRAARAAAERLQQLISRAASVTEVVGVEGELAKRTAEIESLEGRLRVLRDKVDLATVTVSFSPPQPAADDQLPGFLSGFEGGWRALRATAIVGSAVLGALLPWLLPAALVGFLVRVAWRRWRRSHPPRPRPMPPPLWPVAAPVAPGPPADPGPPPSA